MGRSPCRQWLELLRFRTARISEDRFEKLRICFAYYKRKIILKLSYVDEKTQKKKTQILFKP